MKILTDEQRRRWIDWHITYCAGTPNREFNEKAQEILAETNVHLEESPDEPEPAPAGPTDAEVNQRAARLHDAVLYSPANGREWRTAARESLRLEKLAVNKAVAQVTAQRDTVAKNTNEFHVRHVEAIAESAKKDVAKAKSQRDDAVEAYNAAQRRAEKFLIDRDAAIKGKTEDMRKNLDAAFARAALAEKQRSDTNIRAAKDVEKKDRGIRAQTRIIESLKKELGEERAKSRERYIVLDRIVNELGLCEVSHRDLPVLVRGVMAGRDAALSNQADFTKHIAKINVELGEAVATIEKTKEERDVQRRRAEKAEVERLDVIENMKDAISKALKNQ